MSEMRGENKGDLMNEKHDKLKCPCRGCEDRTIDPNCHTNCIAYRMWDAKQKKQKAALDEDRKALYELERDVRWETWRRQEGNGGQV